MTGRRQFGPPRNGCRALQEPALDALDAALCVRLKRARIARAALRMPGLNQDHSVRIEAGRDQHQMFDCSGDQTAGIGERRNHGDLGMRDGRNYNRGRAGVPGQQLGEAIHSHCHFWQGADLAELAIRHHTTSHQRVRSRQGLCRRHSDQSRERCQLAGQAQRTELPSFWVAAQRGVSLSTCQQSLTQLLLGDMPQSAITQHRVDSIGRCCHRRRHALESRKISQRVLHH